MNGPNLKRLLHAGVSVSLALVTVATMIYTVVWPALSARTLLQERMQALQFQGQKFGMATLQTPVLEQELEELAGLETNREGFLEHKPPALAAADLQQLLTSYIEQAGGALLSAQVLQEADGNRLFPAITVKVTMHGATESLQKLLYRIDTGPLRLFPDNLRVQKRQFSGNPALDELEIRFDATAFIYQPETS